MAKGIGQERNADLEIARAGRLEAIAMRREVIQRGYWLSPMLKDHPLPTLDAKEWAVNISAEYRKHESISAVTKGTSVLDRLNEHLPKAPARVPYNTQVAKKSRLEHERLTDAERRQFEAERDQRKAVERAEKQARMKEVEAELRPELTSEEAEERRLNAERQRAANARAKAAADAELKAKKEASQARAAHRARLAAMTPEERKAYEQDLRAKQRVRAKERRVSTARVATVKPRDEDLQPYTEDGALEAALLQPLDVIVNAYLNQRLREARWRAKKRGEVLSATDEAAYLADQRCRLDDRINQDPMHPYRWRAQRMIHERSHAIVRRELNRGTLTEDTKHAALCSLNAQTAKLSTLRQMTPEQRKARRAEQKKQAMKNARAKGKTWRKPRT
jgi:hypothetical protein